MSDVYYRIVAESGQIATLQDFDEYDYEPDAFLKDGSGVPLKFTHEGDAQQYYFGQVRELSEAIQMIGQAWGSMQVPAEARFLAHKLINHFNVLIPNKNETSS
jgi:hypothetical protein